MTNLKILVAELGDDYYTILSYNELLNEYYSPIDNLTTIENEIHTYLLKEHCNAFKIIIDEFEDIINFSIIFYGCDASKIVLMFIDKYFIKIDNPKDRYYCNNLDFTNHLRIKLVDQNTISSKEIESFLIANGIKNFMIIRQKEIFERGASDLLDAFLISLSANVVYDIGKLLLKFIKDKLKERGKEKYNDLLGVEILKIDNSILNNLADLSKLDIKGFYLSRFYKREDNKVDITYRSNKNYLYITCDENMNIEKYQIKKINN
ncbi:MAG TPA: hypothetical protein VIL99_06395 [Ignavibacteria bacterium]